MTEKPTFRKVSIATPPKSPQELFNRLPPTPPWNGYLRGPQQDILRKYSDLPDREQDVAIELPTGAGKTTVGLLIADFHRRQSRRPVAFLAVNKQLAQQVLAEARSLRVPVADLTGDKRTRDPAAAGAFRTASSIAVSTYSNLFNVNPVLQGLHTAIFDDVHSGESYVAQMWTVRLTDDECAELFTAVFHMLTSLLPRHARRSIADPASYPAIYQCALHVSPDTIGRLRDTLDSVQEPAIRFPWQLIREHLPACVALVGRSEITIRPLIPPTHSHPPFHTLSRRVYMSATLASPTDLQRAMGLSSLETLRTDQERSGRRFIFAPQLFADDETARRVLATIWKNLSPRRAVVLCPSWQRLNKFLGDTIALWGTRKPVILRASDIEDDLGAFTNSDNALLALAGRYDGIDLPDDKCRLLIMCDSPAFVSSLDRHLSEHWKLGPHLDVKARTRFIQGLGRCTRTNADFSVVLLFGQSLVDLAMREERNATLPSDVIRELLWGLEQSKSLAGGNTSCINTFAAMTTSLITDESTRQDACAGIDDIPLESASSPQSMLNTHFDRELAYSCSMWAHDYRAAFDAARGIADSASGDLLVGWRAWWLYLAAVAAHHLGNANAELECLNRAVSCGVNAGWIEDVLRRRHVPTDSASDERVMHTQCERVWSTLDRLGWFGPRFQQFIDSMALEIRDAEPTRFHMGLEKLGSLLGAESTRPTGEGDPDVIWSFGGERHVAIEAKSGMKDTGKISKKRVLQARAHRDWVLEHLVEVEEIASVTTVACGPTSALHESARAFAKDLFFVSQSQLCDLAHRATQFASEARNQCAGEGFLACRGDVEKLVVRHGLTTSAIIAEVRMTGVG